MALTRPAVAALLAATASAAGCLPRGPVPAGRRLLDDSTAYGVQFVPEPSGPGRLATLKLTAPGPGAFSVYAVHEPASGEGLGTETFLIDSVDGLVTESGCLYGCPPSTDGQGRPFVSRNQSITSNGAQLDRSSVARLDLVADLAEDLGDSSNLIGTFAQRGAFAYTVQSTLHVRDIEQQEAQFGRLQGTPTVLNDALYFATRDPSSATIQYTLYRLAAPPFDAPQTVVTGITTFMAYPAPVLVLYRTMTADTAAVSSVLDPATGLETPLPTGAGAVWSISPSGRYLFMVRPPAASSGPPAPPSGGEGPDTEAPDGQTTISLFDRTAGTVRSATLAQVNGSYWRPGRDELWFVAPGLGEARSSLWRWAPDSDPAPVLAGQLPFMPLTSDAGKWPFTADGQYLLTFDGASQTDKPVIDLRAADAPTDALLALNPTGTGVQDVRQLPDGRLIVSDWITDSNQADIYLVDGVAGTMTALGHGGNVVATGASRILARLDWVVGGGSGALSLIDLASGATTRLAENVHAVAVEAPSVPGTDPLAPGTRVAYVSRNRVASPYDGLWIVSLP